MPKILDRLVCACVEQNPAKIMSLVPEFLDMYNDGWIVELPCEIIAARAVHHAPDIITRPEAERRLESDS